MARVELTEAADRDLADIYAYTFEQFGERQADRYLQSLESCVEQLARRPMLGRSADRLRAGYRRFEHARHVIFYIEIEDGIRVVRVLHVRMDAKRHL